MARPFFTIVTPSLNSERYLEECIDSVERQSFDDWEHVFIDASSTDRTPAILEAYARRQPGRVHVHRFAKAGIADAFNKGIAHSRGQYLNFLGSDDQLEVEALRVVHDLLSSGAHSWCYGDVTLIDENGQVIRRKRYRPFVYGRLFRFFYICHQSVFMRRDIFDRYGIFDTALKYSMDHEYLLRIGAQEPPLKLKEYVCRYRVSSSGTTTVHWREMLREKRVLHLRYGSPFQRRAASLVEMAVHARRLLRRGGSSAGPR